MIRSPQFDVRQQPKAVGLELGVALVDCQWAERVAAIGQILRERVLMKCGGVRGGEGRVKSTWRTAVGRGVRVECEPKGCKGNVFVGLFEEMMAV